MTSSEIISLLKLDPLPGEGGYFKQTYNDPHEITASWFEGGPTEKRSLASAIYFLVTKDQFSALHRLPQAEIFHFYLGDPVEMTQISPLGELTSVILGNQITQGQQLQVTVPAQTWQGTQIISGGEWALLGCTLSPGFLFKDLELAEQAKLIKTYPRYESKIKALTRI